MASATRGRRMLQAVAVATATGGFLADWNRTHLFNDRWPPHAKFHDGWLLALGVGLGGTALHLLRRRDADTGLPACLLAQFWGAQVSAYAFPGAGDITAEFPDVRDRPGVTKAPEWAAGAAMLLAIALGYGLDRGPRRERSTS